jgi:hypothetical protein
MVKSPGVVVIWRALKLNTPAGEGNGATTGSSEGDECVRWDKNGVDRPARCQESNHSCGNLHPKFDSHIHQSASAQLGVVSLPF